MKISNAALTTPTSGIRAMFELAKKYDNVVSFGLGEPAFDTPQNIIDSACDALNNGYTKYLSNAGLEELRVAIAEKMVRFNGAKEITADNVQVTFGAGQALLLTMHTLLDPGDEVIIPNPCFPNYFSYVHMAGGKSVTVPTYEKDKFRIKAEEIEKAITLKTKAVLINSPCNPTGSILEKEDLIEISKVALKHNIVVISDEPYETIMFDGRKYFSLSSLPEMKDNLIVVNSLSKSYAMTGWRIGYVIAPTAVRERMTLLQEAMGSSVAGAVQKASVEAIAGPQDAVEEMRAAYENRRNLLVNGLNEIKGISCIMPEGSFYAFANITELGMTSQEAAIYLLDKAQVMASPGSTFGDAGEGYLRFSFATDEETIREGLSRLKALLG